MSKATCVIGGCEAPARSRGWCEKHYSRWRAHGDPEFVLQVHASGTPTERFWAKVEKSDGCWEWMAYRTDRGYGSIQVEGKSVAAHRFSYEINVGPIPDGLSICHHCDNPPCVRPDHLFVGTTADNMADRDAKGRQARQSGEQHGMAKLTWALVDEIRAVHAAGGVTQVVLAERYGVSQMAISLLVRGRTWKTEDRPAA